MYFSFINFLSFLSVLFFFLFLCVYHVRLVFLCSNVENVFFLSNQGRQGRLIHTHTHVFLVCIRKQLLGGRRDRGSKSEFGAKTTGIWACFTAGFKLKCFVEL